MTKVIKKREEFFYYLVLRLMPDEFGERVKLRGIVIVHCGNGSDGELDLFSGPSSVRSSSTRSCVVGLTRVPVLVRRRVQEDQGHDVDVPHAVNP